jgi:hypothetical protein
MRNMMTQLPTRALAFRALAVPIAVAIAACDKKEPGEAERTTTSAGGEVAAGSAAVDTGAIAALERMGAYLRSLKAYQVQASTTREDVLADGQKVQFGGVSDVLARPPDRLRAEVTNDRKHRIFLYDGKTFTLWADLLNYYATVPAPGTIAQLADQLQEKFDIELPLVDLFHWGTDRARVRDIKAALDVGPSQVEGTTCEQYAFRQEGLDWQVWIQQGAFPLPRKLVLTTLTDEARPQFTAVLTWNLAPSFNDAAFTFEPPEGAQKIVLAAAEAAEAAASGGDKPAGKPGDKP